MLELTSLPTFVISGGCGLFHARCVSVPDILQNERDFSQSSNKYHDIQHEF